MTAADRETLAKSAIGNMMMSIVDGSLGSVPQEDMLGIADAIAGAPHIAAGFVMGKDFTGKDDGSIDGRALRDRAMGMFYEAQFTDMQSAMLEELDMDATQSRNERRDAIISYTRMTPEEVGRAEFDAENGDESLMVQAEERFYLG